MKKGYTSDIGRGGVRGRREWRVPRVREDVGGAGEPREPYSLLLSPAQAFVDSPLTPAREEKKVFVSLGSHRSVEHAHVTKRI